MASTTSFLLSALILLVSVSSLAGHANANADPGGLHLAADSIDWPGSVSAYSHSFDSDPEDDLAGDYSDESGMQRRSLFWRQRHLSHYYISYGALSANRVPCPPRSGRSYYTHNCHRARDPVYPYARGCNAITLCRR